MRVFRSYIKVESNSKFIYIIGSIIKTYLYVVQLCSVSKLLVSKVLVSTASNLTV
jgi:hypothetical protein